MIKKFAVLKRGVLCFLASPVENQYLIQQSLKPALVKGVYIICLQNESIVAAEDLKERDIIEGIDGILINSAIELFESIAGHKPGDINKLNYQNQGKIISTAANLYSEAVAKMTSRQVKLIKRS